MVRNYIYCTKSWFSVTVIHLKKEISSKCRRLIIKQTKEMA